MTQTTMPRVTGVTPYVNVRDARAAIALYQRAFGAEVLHEIPTPDGKQVLHCCLRINGDHVFLNDAYPDGTQPPPPQAFALHLQVEDAEAWWKRAVAAGLDVKHPLAVQFWGDKFGALEDALGVRWSIGGPNR